MSGKGVIEHNRRTYIAENIDLGRTHLNIEYCYTSIEQAYHELFDEALAAYNAKQKRKDRCIENYYKKICDGDQEKPFYEVIFQIGNKDDMSAASENGELARAVLDKFMRSFQERNPHLHVFLIDNADEIKPGVQAEIDTVKKYNIKALYYFCDEIQKEKTALEQSLMGAHFAKSKTVHSFSELSQDGARALIDDRSPDPFLSVSCRSWPDTGR